MRQAEYRRKKKIEQLSVCAVVVTPNITRVACIYDDDDLEINIKLGQLLGRPRPKRLKWGGDRDADCCCAQQGIGVELSCTPVHIHPNSKTTTTSNVLLLLLLLYYEYKRERKDTTSMSERTLDFLPESLFQRCLFAEWLISRDMMKMQIGRIRKQLVLWRRGNACLFITRKTNRWLYWSWR